MVSLHCTISSVEPLKNFSKKWITGSANQKVSNVLDHATSDVHEVAMGRLRMESIRARGRSAMLVLANSHCLYMMDHET